MKKYYIIKKTFLLLILLMLCGCLFAQTKTKDSKSATKDRTARELAREREKERVERKKAADKQDAYEEAVEVFQLNKPEEAIPLLEAFLENDKEETYNPDVYVYLSVAYYQIKEYQKAIDICEAGLKKEDTNFKVLYFNEGNAAYALGEYKKSEVLYRKSLEIDSVYAPAILNLANAQLHQDNIEDARNNYVLYLEAKPETVQRPEIEKMIGLLDEEIAFRLKQGPELVNGELPEDKNKEESPLPAEIISDEDVVSSGSVNRVDGPREQMSNSETEAPDLPNSQEKKNYGEILDSKDNYAPALPVDRTDNKIKGEKLNKSDNTAPSLPPETNDSNKKKGEAVKSSDYNAPELPAERKQENKVKGEKLNKSDDVNPALPVETNKTNKKKGEAVKASDSTAPDLPSDNSKTKQKEEKLKDVQAPKLEDETKKSSDKTEDFGNIIDIEIKDTADAK